MANSQKQDIELGITRFEYGDMARKQVAVLEIETSKYCNGGIVSDVTVYWVGNHSRQTCMSLGGGGGDYGKTLKRSSREVKATQKAIDRQHAEIFTTEAVAQLVEYAKLHYASAIRAGVDGFNNTYPAVAA
jgi:hypothetical protein